MTKEEMENRDPYPWMGPKETGRWKEELAAIGVLLCVLAIVYVCLFMR